MNASSMDTREWWKERTGDLIAFYQQLFLWMTQVATQGFIVPHFLRNSILCVFRKVQHHIQLDQVYLFAAFTPTGVSLICQIFLEYLLCFRHFAKFATFSPDIRPKKIFCSVWILVFSVLLFLFRSIH